MRTLGAILGLAGTITLGLLMLVPWAPPWPLAPPALRSASTPSVHVVVNEVAWGGTAASASDEWVELINTSSTSASLAGWRLVAADGSPDISLLGSIAPYGYYLIERTDDTTVANVPADLTASFGTGLSNDGETLLLLDGAGSVVDTVNASGGSWPTEDGGSPYYRAMERLSPIAPDESDQWCSNDGTTSVALDANGDPINGSPGVMNAAFAPLWAETSDILVQKRGPDTLLVGDAATYQIRLSNYGGLTATRMHLADVLPEVLQYVDQQSDLPFTRTGQTMAWSIAALPPSAHIDVTLTAQLTSPVQPGSTVANHVTVTMPISDLCSWNNLTTWTTVVDLPEPAAEAVLISGVLCDGYQYNDEDEAVELTNTATTTVLLRDWALCHDDSGQPTCKALPDVEIPPAGSVWLAKNAAAFTASFGVTPTAELSSWLRLANTGGEVLLRDNSGRIADALVYGDGTLAAPDWVGPPLTAYSSPNLRGVAGQILARALDELSGLPVTDTNTSADWLQYPDDVFLGRRVRYAGWDMAALYQPLTATEPATLTLAVAPDNAFEVVAETLSQAKDSIAIEAYTFRHAGLLDILTAKARQGVNVTLLLEGDPVGLGDITLEWREELAACQAIEAAGGACWFMIHEPADYVYNRYEYLHAKMIIVDDHWLVLGSQNLTPTSLPSDIKSNGTLGSRGSVVVIQAPSVVARAREVFRFDLDTAHQDILRWGTGYLDRYGPPPEGTELSPPRDEVSYTVRFPAPRVVTGLLELELPTAPEAALRRSDGLAGLLVRAGHGDKIYVEQQYERLMWGADPITGHNPRLLDYANAARRGARVRVLLNGHSFVEGYVGPDEENLATVGYLNALASAEGLDLRASLGDPTGAGIHNKMALVDLGSAGRYLHLGSINGSEASSKTNREVALQVRSDAAHDYFLALFQSDWYRANPIYMPLISRNYTPPPPPVGHLVITEICYLCEPMAEWIEIANPGSSTVDLSLYKVGDAETPEVYESMFQFPAGTVLPPDGVLVIAVNAINVPESTLEFYESDPGVPNLTPYPGWGDPTYPFALRNAGDQVLLLNQADEIVDAVVWGDGSLAGVVPHPGTATIGASLERVPAYQDTDNCAADFHERYPPTPGTLP